MTETQHNIFPKFEFKQAQETPISDYQVGLVLGENGEGPMAMSYELDVGWVANKLGPNSGHWKRRAQAGPDVGNKEELGPIQRKSEGPIPLIELDQNIKVTKRRKGEAQGKENTGKKIVKDGSVAVAARQNRGAQ